MAWIGHILALGPAGETSPVPAAEALRMFVAVLIIVVLSLLASGYWFYRLQRVRVLAVLVSGGWLAITTGFLLGPNVLNVIDPETLLEVRPLLMIGLGWIGVIVGMQLKWELLAAVPTVLWKWAAVDALLSASLVALVTLGVLIYAFPSENVQLHWLLVPLALMAACAIGWAPETRSLHPGHGPGAAQLVALIKGGGGMTAVWAILLFGLVFKFAGRRPEGDVAIQPLEALVAMLLAMLIALFFGLAARVLMQLAGGERSQHLVVFLGVVCVTAGVAAELSYSPLFAALLVGMVIANTHRIGGGSGGELTHAFEWLLLKAEHAVAAMFYLLAGVLLHPTIGLWGWCLVAAVVAIRLLLKPALMRRALSPFTAEVPERSPLFTAPVRQSPIAIALAIGLVLLESSMFHRMLLTVVVLIGLLSDVLPIMISVLRRRLPAFYESPADDAAGGFATGAHPGVKA